MWPQRPVKRKNSDKLLSSFVLHTTCVEAAMFACRGDSKRWRWPNGTVLKLRLIQTASMREYNFEAQFVHDKLQTPRNPHLAASLCFILLVAILFFRWLGLHLCLSSTLRLAFICPRFLSNWLFSLSLLFIGTTDETCSEAHRPRFIRHARCGG